MKYECTIKHGFRCQEIEADSIEDAQLAFIERLHDNLETEHVEAVNMETEDGLDPLPDPNAAADTRRGENDANRK